MENKYEETCICELCGKLSDSNIKLLEKNICIECTERISKNFSHRKKYIEESHELYDEFISEHNEDFDFMLFLFLIAVVVGYNGYRLAKRFNKFLINNGVTNLYRIGIFLRYFNIISNCWVYNNKILFKEK